MSKHVQRSEHPDAEVVPLAVELYAVATLAPLRAATEKVYSVLELSPVTVFVPQVESVAQASESPSVPSDCTYFVVAP